MTRLNFGLKKTLSIALRNLDHVSTRVLLGLSLLKTLQVTLMSLEKKHSQKREFLVILGLEAPIETKHT